MQRGRWNLRDHRAHAVTGAIGHRLTGLPARPWLRGGVSWASGDDQPNDGRHGTFVPLLPSGDHVSRLNAYALMNVVDQWLSVDLAPAASFDVTASVHRVGMASAQDQWYQGSGPSQRSGSYFGFQGRPTFGDTRLGTVVDGTVTWRPLRWWTLRASAGRIAGDRVVWRNFADRRLFSGWLESTIRF